MNRLLPIVVLLLLGADWPQWRGPARDGTAPGSFSLAGWPEKGQPKVAWRVDVGKGHSGVAVAGGRAYTAGWDGERETLFCLDAATGKERWRYRWPSAGGGQWPGPRATPMVTADAVYALGQHGLLVALDPANGDLRWKKQLPKAAEPDGDYGFCWSPLAEGGLVVFPCGRGGLALRARDGTVAWGDDGRQGACCSPVPFDHAGKRCVLLVLMTGEDRESVSLVGTETATGKEVFRFAEWPEKWGAACADPLVADGKVFVSTAEQHQQCARFTIDGRRLKREWANRLLPCYTGGVVLVGGHVYGVTKVGLLKCVDWATGKEKWSQREFGGHGAISAADGKLFVINSRTGELTVAAADPAGFQQLRKSRPFRAEGETFTAPTLADGRVYCRSYRGEVVCLEVGGGE